MPVCDLISFSGSQSWALSLFLLAIGLKRNCRSLPFFGVFRAVIEGQSLVFLLYDPVSLLIWAIVLVFAGYLGPGPVCGWLCPYGAMQEFSHYVGKWLRLPQIRLSDQADRWLKGLKYGLLAMLVVSAFLSAVWMDRLVEIEPFKTAITVGFEREWYYAAYALFWLVLGLFLFKGFCRYVCPLGAFLALGGLWRSHRWIERRAECGSPCQLCKVRCKYGAIEKSGAIRYDDCFACLDCVQIHDDPKSCVPLVLAQKRRSPA